MFLKYKYVLNLAVQIDIDCKGKYVEMQHCEVLGWLWQKIEPTNSGWWAVCLATVLHSMELKIKTKFSHFSNGLRGFFMSWVRYLHFFLFTLTEKNMPRALNNCKVICTTPVLFSLALKWLLWLLYMCIHRNIKLRPLTQFKLTAQVKR